MGGIAALAREAFRGGAVYCLFWGGFAFDCAVIARGLLEGGSPIFEPHLFWVARICTFAVASGTQRLRAVLHNKN